MSSSKWKLFTSIIEDCRMNDSWWILFYIQTFQNNVRHLFIIRSLNIYKRPNFIIELEAICKMPKTKLAFKLFPRNCMMAIWALRLHLIFHPNFKTFKVNPFNRSITFTRRNLRVILCFSLWPANSAHCLPSFFHIFRYILYFWKFFIRIIFARIKLILSSKLFNFKFHSTKFDNVMILYCVAFIFQWTDNKPKSVICMILSISDQCEWTLLKWVLLEIKEQCTLFFI